MASINKSSPPERPLKREAGGGCPSCTYPSTCCSCNADCSSTASSYCPSQCRYSLSSRQAPDCQSCSSPTSLKSIWKKRNYCQCNTSYCLCQPMSRGCNCPLPVQADVRAARECSCDCPSSPECACPPSERRFPKTTVKCPNTRFCCPLPRLTPTPKCYCARCTSCLPSVCHPCTSTKCRDQPISSNNSCCPRLPTTCLRPASAASSSRPPTPRKKLTFCVERSSRPSSPCRGTGQSLRSCITDDRNSENSIHNEGNDIKEREKYDVKNCDCCCAADCTESENGFEHVDESYDLTLDERSELENLTSKVLINSSEITKSPKSVDPDLLDMPEKRSKSALENTKMQKSLHDIRSKNL
ncbi:Kazal-type serine protease inhibitor domain-containing protein 1 [Camponotus japonicus]